MWVLSLYVNFYLMPHHAIAGQPCLDIEKLKTGDAESFQRLYQLFYKDLAKKAASLLDEKEKAPTLVNHCFIKCWLRSEALTSMDYISAFLTTTLRNNCTACNSNNGSHSVHYSCVLGVILSDSVRNGLTRKELFSGIDALPTAELSDARAIFKRFYDRRMVVTDIAREMGKEPSNTVTGLTTAFQVLHLILYIENI
jgi:DNA-directed RNA polymerase specialized sigma24 family protein